MAETKYANWDDPNTWGESQLDYLGQTFTPATSHLATKMKLRSWTGDGAVESSTLYICNTDENGFPVGGSSWHNYYLVKLIKTGTFGDVDGSWVEWEFATHPVLLADTKYCWVVVGTAERGTWLRRRYEASGEPYAGEQMSMYDTSEGEWVASSENALSFEDWGTPYVLYPSEAITRVTGIRHIYRPGFFRMILSLGDVSNTVEIAEARVRRELEIPEQQTPELEPPTVPTPQEEDRKLWEAAERVRQEEEARRREEERRTREADDRRLWEANERIREEIRKSIEEQDRRLYEANERLKRELEEQRRKEVAEMEERARRFREAGGAAPSPRLPNRCPHCGLAFATQTELHAHIRQKHGGM